MLCCAFHVALAELVVHVRHARMPCHSMHARMPCHSMHARMPCHSMHARMPTAQHAHVVSMPRIIESNGSDLGWPGGPGRALPQTRRSSRHDIVRRITARMQHGSGRAFGMAQVWHFVWRDVHSYKCPLYSSLILFPILPLADPYTSRCYPLYYSLLPLVMMISITLKYYAIRADTLPLSMTLRWVLSDCLETCFRIPRAPVPAQALPLGPSGTAGA